MRSKQSICNDIKYSRRYGRENTMSVLLVDHAVEIDGIDISAYTQCRYNKKTDNVSVSTSLYTCGRRIHYGANSKRDCNDPICRELMSVRRNKIYIDTKCVSTSIGYINGYQLSTMDRIDYNAITGSINISSRLTGKHNGKLYSVSLTKAAVNK